MLTRLILLIAFSLSFCHSAAARPGPAVARPGSEGDKVGNGGEGISIQVTDTGYRIYRHLSQYAAQIPSITPEILAAWHRALLETRVDIISIADTPDSIRNMIGEYTTSGIITIFAGPWQTTYRQEPQVLYPLVLELYARASGQSPAAAKALAAAATDTLAGIISRLRSAGYWLPVKPGSFAECEGHDALLGIAMSRVGDRRPAAILCQPRTATTATATVKAVNSSSHGSIATTHCPSGTAANGISISNHQEDAATAYLRCAAEAPVGKTLRLPLSFAGPGDVAETQCPLGVITGIEMYLRDDHHMIALYCSGDDQAAAAEAKAFTSLAYHTQGALEAYTDVWGDDWQEAQIQDLAKAVQTASVIMHAGPLFDDYGNEIPMRRKGPATIEWDITAWRRLKDDPSKALQLYRLILHTYLNLAGRPDEQFALSAPTAQVIAGLVSREQQRQTWLLVPPSVAVVCPAGRAVFEFSTRRLADDDRHLSAIGCRDLPALDLPAYRQQPTQVVVIDESTPDWQLCPAGHAVAGVKSRITPNPHTGRPDRRLQELYCRPFADTAEITESGSFYGNFQYARRDHNCGSDVYLGFPMMLGEDISVTGSACADVNQ